MPTDPQPQPLPQNASMKDVYDAVNSVRIELGEKIDQQGQKIDDLAATVSTIVTSHEHRLTSSEKDIGTIMRQQALHAEKLEEHGKEIGSIMNRMRDDEAQQKALDMERSRRSNNVRWLVGTLIALLGIVLSLVILLH